jgi:hypothetical protein
MVRPGFPRPKPRFGPIDDDLHVLFDLPHLRSVTLCGPYLTGEGLARLANLPRLKSLRLEWTDLDGQEWRRLAELPTLEELSVRYQSLDANDLAAIASLTRLRTLRLQEIGVFDYKRESARGRSKGMDFFEEVVWLTPAPAPAGYNLLLFPRAQPEFGLNDSHALKLAAMTHLSELHLDSVHLTDACVPTLARLTSLERLSIHDTLITLDGAAELMAALPNCQIDYSPRVENSVP